MAYPQRARCDTREDFNEAFEELVKRSPMPQIAKMAYPQRARYDTRQDFDEAFEELVKRSPMPQIAKPSFAAYRSPVPQLRGQEGGVKAVFDMMKKRNTSMSSDLNTSLFSPTAEVSFSMPTSDLFSRCPGHAVPKDKENSTPEKDPDQNPVPERAAADDRGQEKAAFLLQSPAMQATENFACSAAHVDHLQQADITHSRAALAHTAVMSRLDSENTLTSRPRDKEDDQGASSAKTSAENDTGRSCAANPVAIRAGGPAAQELMKPVTNSLTSPEEQSADEETLQLVSKLVQRLQSHTESDSDSTYYESGSRQVYPHRHTLYNGPEAETCPLPVQVPQSAANKDRSEIPEENVAAPSKKAQKSARKEKRVANTDKPVGCGVRKLRLESWQLSQMSLVDSCEREKVLPRKQQSAEMGDVEIEADSSEETSLPRPEVQYSSNGDVGSRPVTDSTDGDMGSRPRTGRGTAAKVKEKQSHHVTRGLRKKEKVKSAASDALSSSSQQNFGLQAWCEVAGATSIKAQDIEADVIVKKSAGTFATEADIFSLNMTSEVDSQEVEDDTLLCALRKPRSAPAAGSKQHKSTKSMSASGSGPDCPWAEDSRQLDKVQPAVKRSTQKDRNEVLKLRSWSLQPVPKFNAVRVEGKLPNTEHFWCSSLIRERVSSRLLKSTNGSHYSLVGNISMINTIHAGFSREVAKKFQYGFPVDWEELVQSEMKATKSLSTVQEESVGDSPARNSKEQKLKGHLKKSACHTPVVARREHPAVCHTPELQVKKDGDSTIWTPVGIISRAIDVGQVQKTQSGRCVIPPLARWAGQYVQRDADGSVTIGFQTQAAEQHFAKMAQHQMNTSFKQRVGGLSTSLPHTVSPALSSHSTKTATSATRSRQQNKQQNKQRGGLNYEAVSKEKAPALKSLDTADLPVDKMSQNAALKSEMGRNAKESGSNGTSVCSQVEVDNMAEEVMAILKRSRSVQQRRRIASRRKTCYSQVDQGHADRSFDLSDDEEQHVSKPYPNRQGGRREAVATTADHKTDSRLEKTAVVVVARNKTAESSVEKNTNKHTVKAGRTRNPAGKARRDRTKKQPVPTPVTVKCKVDSVGSQVAKRLSYSPIADEAASETSLHSNENSEVASAKTAQRRRPHGGGASRETEQGGGRSGCSNNRTKQKDTVVEEDSLDEFQQKTRAKVSQASRFQQSVAAKCSEEMDNGNRKRRRPPSKKSATKTERGGKKKKADEESRPWSGEEVELLQVAREQLSGDHPHFWELVSQHIGTRSAEECASYCMQEMPETRSRSAKRQLTEKQKTGCGDVPVLQAKQGTLKRRQELRAVLEHENVNVEDDLFDSTPLRTKHRAKVPSIDFGKSDEEVFGQNPNFFTPRFDGSHKLSSHFSKTPVSSRKTPSISAFSPWQEKNSTRRNAIDQYVFRLQKNRRQLTKSLSQKKEAKTADPPAVQLFGQSHKSSNMFTIHTHNSHDEDDDESTDYYYSDEDN